jgi:hypothetical protein
MSNISLACAGCECKVCEEECVIDLSEPCGAVADKDSDSCLKLRFSNHQILKTVS